jgi:hypothetical protein
MAYDFHPLLAKSNVATAPSPATSGTSLTVTLSEGANFPNPASVGQYNATLAPAGNDPDINNAEIVRITARTGDVITIVRAQEGSAARSVLVGDRIYASVTPKVLTDFEVNAPAPGGANTVLHGTGTPAYSAVVEADISFSNNATGNASASKHGFLPILDNVSTHFLNGQGNLVTVTATGSIPGYLSQSFSAQTSVNVIHNFGVLPVVQVVDNAGSPLQFVPLNVTHNSLNDFTVTFSVSSSGQILASAGSAPVPNLTATSTNYVITANDNIIKATTVNITITLPTAVGRQGKVYTIDNSTIGNVLTNTTSSQTINGNLTQTIPTQSAMEVYSDGANWRIK